MTYTLGRKGGSAAPHDPSLDPPLKRGIRMIGGACATHAVDMNLFIHSKLLPFAGTSYRNSLLFRPENFRAQNFRVK